jgi:alkanesulfonate monooxygenase SsuD/methylene tetrahydromethanopterin reductase-like flavin-dependent oxidoreductase (luciferase family)
MSMEPRRRQMTLVAFLQAQNCSNYPASWRHAATTPDFMSADYYQRIARTLEDGRFHMAFFDDRLAMPDRYGDDFRESVRHGIRVVKLDPVPLLTAMGMATRHLGLGATYSTTYHEPFHVARLFSTLDHLVGGRAAWNVVTSLNDSEAANFGQEEHPDHDLRYDRADEFMDAVMGTGTRGRTMPLPSTRRGVSLRTRTRCTVSTTAANGFARAAPSRCRARRRGVPSSSRPDRAAVAGRSRRDGGS